MVPSVTLNNGNKMPCLGLGTGTLDAKERGAMYQVSKVFIFKQIILLIRTCQATKDAITAGYRHFDTAAFYGTETFVGRAVNEAITSGEVKREDLFITTKLWMNSMKREDVSFSKEIF